ncbi:cell division control protein 6 homolog [Panulirus ornatus]|uniref:cell division control protein 6 homolog n=1 Tax=Panulirus ornatus TaxID=150431 RepID=UPI003A8580D5
MHTEQDSICFPIRKTRSSRTNSKKPITSPASSTLSADCCAKSKILDCSQKCTCKVETPFKADNKCCSTQRSSQKAEMLSRTTQVDMLPKLIILSDSPRRSSRNKDIHSKPHPCSSPHKSTERTSTASKLVSVFSLEKSSHGREILPDFSSVRSTPRRILLRSSSSARNEKGEADKGQVTPRKQRTNSQEMEDGLSPAKRPFVVLSKLSMESPKLTSKACRRLMSDPAKLEDYPSQSSPEKSMENLPLSLQKLSSPTKTSSSLEPRITRQQTPQKSPLSPSTSASNITSSDCVNKVIFQSPSKCPVRCFELNSPVKKSPSKFPDLNTAIKSPLKRLDMGSPRRSPRKYNQENRFSPRRSPRKLQQSPLQFSSPSSLVSRLSLTSPASNKKNIAVGLFKPDVTAYCALRQSLNTGTPTVLVCREKQISEMQDFLTHHLSCAKPGSLYISGAPGTGKTASLYTILDSLKVNKIKKVFLNCMTLNTSSAIYKAIALEMGLKMRGTERENLHSIEKAITTSKYPVLIMLDEVDQLDSKNQEVLYTIFEWPALAGSTLVLVGIANSLDLTDRILPRLQARPTFKPKLLHFPPYTKAEIVKIINHRIQEAGLGDLQVIRPTAIQFLAGKVASVAGDARKALDVCRRAVELCEIQARRQSVLKPSNGSPRKSPLKQQENARMKMVEVPQILSIFNEIYGSRVVSAVKDAPESFPLQQKVLICCLLLILKHARSKDVTLGKFHEVHARICKKRQMPGMDQSEFLSMCTLLESRGMLQVKRAKEIRSSKIILRLNAEEAEQTLGDRNLLANILEDRESLGKMCKS